MMEGSSTDWSEITSLTPSSRTIGSSNFLEADVLGLQDGKMHEFTIRSVIEHSKLKGYSDWSENYYVYVSNSAPSNNTVAGYFWNENWTDQNYEYFICSGSFGKNIKDREAWLKDLRNGIGSWEKSAKWLSVSGVNIVRPKEANSGICDKLYKSSIIKSFDDDKSYKKACNLKDLDDSNGCMAPEGPSGKVPETKSIFIRGSADWQPGVGQNNGCPFPHTIVAHELGHAVGFADKHPKMRSPRVLMEGSIETGMCGPQPLDVGVLMAWFQYLPTATPTP